jgi:hypothetical protein
VIPAFFLPRNGCWISIQKNHIALYHMGLYAHPEILDWFVKEYPKQSTLKLDMGKTARCPCWVMRICKNIEQNIG